MPVLGSRMPPRDSMLWFGVKEGVADTEVMVAAEFQQALPIFVHAPNAKLSKAAWPGVVVSAHPGIKISKDEH